jgi:hypothetical protein
VLYWKLALEYSGTFFHGYGNAILSLTYTRTATLHETLILFIEAVAFVIWQLDFAEAGRYLPL